MDKSALIQKVTALSEPIAAEEGMEVVEVEFGIDRGRRVLRIYVDKPGGVSHADCARVSSQLDKLLDVEDPIASSYLLEVSSPGLARPLRRARDFERFAGERVRVEVRVPVGGQRNFRGTLRGLEGGEILLEVEPDRTGSPSGEPLGVPRTVRLPLEDVAKARLEVDWKKVFGRKGDATP
ncbi:MAG: ribosome maturation factor RimP [Nitrospinota bacterium]